jgi:hypothetical protein
MMSETVATGDLPAVFVVARQKVFHMLFQECIGNVSSQDSSVSLHDATASAALKQIWKGSRDGSWWLPVASF